MAEVFLLQTRQGAVLIHPVEEIEHRGRERLVTIERAEPGDGLLVSDVQRYRQFRVNTLKQADGYRVSDGVGQFAVDDLLQQRRSAQLLIHRPVEVRVLLLFQRPQVVNHHMPRGDGELFSAEAGKGARAQAADAIDQLLRDGVIGGARLIVFAALAVIDQSGGQHIGLAIIQVVKQLADVLAHGDPELNAQIVSKVLCQLVVQANRFVVDGAVGQRRREGTDAQLPPRLNGGDAIFGLAEPGD